MALGEPRPEFEARLLAFSFGLTFLELHNLGGIPSLPLCSSTFDKRDSTAYVLETFEAKEKGQTSPLGSRHSVGALVANSSQESQY